MMSSRLKNQFLRKVGVEQERTGIDGESANESTTGGFIIRTPDEAAAGKEIGSALIINEAEGAVKSYNEIKPLLESPASTPEFEADETVESFDLSELLE